MQINTDSSRRDIRLGTHEVTPYLATLPTDIFPQIFTRLPYRELPLLAQVSKQFAHFSYERMQDEGAQVLAAALPLATLQDWETLLSTLRTASPQIRPDDWNAFLKSVDIAGASRSLVQLLLLAPNVATENATIAVITRNMPLDPLGGQLDPFVRSYSRQTPKGAIHISEQRTDREVLQLAVTGWLAHAFHHAQDQGSQANAHSFGASSDLPGFLAILPNLPPTVFAEALANLGAWHQEHEGIRLGVRKLVDIHLQHFMASEQRHRFNLVFQAPDRKKESWFTMLAMTHGLGPISGNKTYMETLFSEFFTVTSCSEFFTVTSRNSPAQPWREHPPAFARCALIAMALSMAAGKGRSPLGETMVECGFINKHEARRLSKKTGEAGKAGADSTHILAIVDKLMSTSSSRGKCTTS